MMVREFGGGEGARKNDSGRGYERAIELLDSTRRVARPREVVSSGLAAAAARRTTTTPGKAVLKGRPSVEGMSGWMAELGYSPTTVNALNIIHVAGTKGKGSTCAFIESLLRAHRSATRCEGEAEGNGKGGVGMYTSPHLLSPRERIRIDGLAISEEKFAWWFFEVWDVLFGSSSSLSSPPPPTTATTTEMAEKGPRPRYLQLCVLVALHAFIQHGVSAVVLETHHGGEFDATNFIEKPVVAVVTALGRDHVQQLGPGMGDIAWHKAGVFKEGAGAVVAPQGDVEGREEVMEVLRGRGRERGVRVVCVDVDEVEGVEGVRPEVQRGNCAVAVVAVGMFLERTGGGVLGVESVRTGVEGFRWPGRFQIVERGGGSERWWLDGAHNEMSVGIAGQWFADGVGARDTTDRERILLFSQISDQRDSEAVFRCLAESLKGSGVQLVIFTTYDPEQTFSSSSSVSSDAPAAAAVAAATTTMTTILPLREAYERIWRETHPGTAVMFVPQLGEAMGIVRRKGEGAGGVDVLITGSLHLVGGALWWLDESV